MEIFNIHTEPDHVDEYEEWIKPDYHSAYTIQLCELINDGWIDFSSEEWDFDDYNVEQRNRLWKKFTRRFYYREIGILPPGRWKWELLRKLDEIMPKYKPIYEMLENGQNILHQEYFPAFLFREGLNALHQGYA